MCAYTDHDMVYIFAHSHMYIYACICVDVNQLPITV